jgi:hypothetical protein
VDQFHGCAKRIRLRICNLKKGGNDGSQEEAFFQRDSKTRLQSEKIRWGGEKETGHQGSGEIPRIAQSQEHGAQSHGRCRTQIIFAQQVVCIEGGQKASCTRQNCSTEIHAKASTSEKIDRTPRSSLQTQRAEAHAQSAIPSFENDGH